MSSLPRFCGQCAAPLRDGQRFCAECGTPVVDDPLPDAPTLPGSPPPGAFVDSEEPTEVIDRGSLPGVAPPPPAPPAGEAVSTSFSRGPGRSMARSAATGAPPTGEPSGSSGRLRVLLIAIGSVIALAVIGGGIFFWLSGDDDEATATAATVTATLARGERNGQPVNPTTTFEPTADVIFATFTVSDAKTGDRVKGVWTAVNVGSAAAPNTKIDETTLTLTKASETNFFRLTRQSPRWAPGDYKLEIFVNDRSALTLPYRVSAAAVQPTRTPAPTASPRATATPTPSATRSPSPTPARSPGASPAGSPGASPTGARTPSPASTPGRSPGATTAGGATATGGPITVTLARNVTDDFEPVQPTTTFQPSAETFQVAFKANGAPAGARLRSVWTMVDVGSAAAPNTEIDQTGLTLERGNESGVFRLRRSSQPWPVGSYKVDFYLNDQLVLTMPFRVAQ